MQCPQCQHDNREQARFCEGCGTRLLARCSECGTELGPGARFCSECGTPAAGPSPAALRMQESVKQYAAEIRSTVGVPLQIRIGLNSGEVVVRSIASDLRMDYSAVGQHTHLAARMEQSATPGTILLTAETLRLVEGY